MRAMRSCFCEHLHLYVGWLLPWASGAVREEALISVAHPAYFLSTNIVFVTFCPMLSLTVQINGFSPDDATNHDGGISSGKEYRHGPNRAAHAVIHPHHVTCVAWCRFCLFFTYWILQTSKIGRVKLPSRNCFDLPVHSVCFSNYACFAVVVTYLIGRRKKTRK